MKLEDQVCSLDLAKRLKELGVKQESVWYWFRDRLILGMQEGFNMRVLTPAYTVAELGEMLPCTLGEPNAPKQIDVEMYSYHSPRRYECAVSDYVDMGGQHLPHQIYHAIEPTEADARAKMLIYLIENKLITL